MFVKNAPFFFTWSLIVKKPTDLNWVSDQTWFEQRAAEREEKRKHDLDEAAEKNKGNAGASIFGGAKPVDDAKLRAREQEIEVSQLIDRRSTLQQCQINQVFGEKATFFSL